MRLTGPAVGPGRLAARDLADLARLLDQALLRVARILCEGRGRDAGLRSRDLEAACRLYLVLWTEGSAVAGFDLVQPQARALSLHEIGQRSLHHFVAGLSHIAAEEPFDTPLPEGFDEGVLETCAAPGEIARPRYRNAKLLRALGGSIHRPVTIFRCVGAFELSLIGSAF